MLPATSAFEEQNADRSRASADEQLFNYKRSSVGTLKSASTFYDSSDCGSPIWSVGSHSAFGDKSVDSLSPSANVQLLDDMENMVGTSWSDSTLFESSDGGSSIRNVQEHAKTSFLVHRIP